MLVMCSIVVDVYFFFFKQKTAYEMRISDWSSDVCSSDLNLSETAPAARPVAAKDAAALQDAILYRDDNIIALNKPAGLAVQGGSGQSRHLDGMLEEIGRASCRERGCQYV